jgi:hypothetical protein
VVVGETDIEEELVAPTMFVQFESVADGAVVLELTLDCHWIAPTEPDAKLSVLLPPLQIAPVVAKDTAFTTEIGLTVTTATLDVEVGQAPLDTTT